MFSKWSLAKQFVASFVLVMGLLGIFLSLSRDSTHGLKDSTFAVRRNHEILNSLGQVLTHLEKAEAGYRGYVITGDSSYLQPVQQLDTSITQELTKVREVVSTNPEQLRRLEALPPLIKQALDGLNNNVELRRAQGFDSTLSRSQTEELKRLTDRVRSGVAELRQVELAALEKNNEKMEKDVVIFDQSFWGGGMVITVLMLGTAAILGKSLEKKLHTAISQVQSSSAELQAAASQQASGSREQASATTEISTTVKELLSTSRQIASSAQQVARVADDTAGAARTGNDTVHHAQEAIDVVRRQVDSIVNHMLDLGKRSQEIGGIVDIINELAEQTNILAINATIESAGAGEHGKRFAVVAEEIRKLADRVGSATKDIRVLIDEIRAASNTTVMATEDGSKAVQSSAKQFADVAGNFRRIAELVRTNLDVAREIEMSTQQQTTAVEQVNTAILEVAHTARQSETSSTQTLQTANQLSQLSKQLASIVSASRT